jgi:putative RNA 2'-phosphotransferase
MNLTRLSKFLSLGLRHDDTVLGTPVNEEGWASTAGIISHNKEFSMSLLEQIVETDSKGRYSFNEDKTMIRANQGHSLKHVNIDFEERVPAQFLYHGTAKRNIESILENGLAPKSRQYVHMSADVQTALEVGRRYCKDDDVVVLCIDAFHAAKEIKFFISVNNVWLAKKIDSKFIININKED